jgi:hypothetical protein
MKNISLSPRARLIQSPTCATDTFPTLVTICDNFGSTGQLNSLTDLVVPAECTDSYVVPDCVGTGVAHDLVDIETTPRT